MAEPLSWKRRLVRVVRVFVLLPLGLLVLGLAACQGRLIYPAPRYGAQVLDRIPSDTVPLRYETDQGKQVSFYQSPRSGGEPKRLWLVCSGNGAFALGWLDLLKVQPDPEAGFLLLDYPGYGLCEGSCTPGRILTASEAAVTALGEHLRLPRDELDRRLGVFGHSLGAAAVLQYAARHPVRRIVLAAPFTTMVQEAHHALFWPMGWLCWHRFDNEDRLAEIASRQPRPPVDIVHGDADQMIPQAMGRSLADTWPDWIRFHSIPGVGHDEVALDGVRLLGEGP